MRDWVHCSSSKVVRLLHRGDARNAGSRSELAAKPRVHFAAPEFSGVKTFYRNHTVIGYYSYFRESTGLDLATLSDFALTTNKAIANTRAPGKTKSHH